jgi:hypothetical protein
VLTAALIPVPAFASETGPASKATPTRTSLQTAVAREAAKMATAVTVVRHDQQTTSATTHGTSFFKSKPGMIALAVMGIGTGYALYSAQHDRVKSPAKQ